MIKLEQINNIYEIRHKIDLEHQQAFEFVISAIRIFFNESNDGKLENIDCFGFIDRDFGHDIGGDINSFISSTNAHDRETNLIKCYMRDYFERIDDKDKAIEIFYKVTEFCYMQGILEKTSFEMENDPINSIDCKKVAHSYFKRNANKKDFRNFNFANHFDLNRDRFNTSPRSEGCYQKFIEKFYNNLRIYYYPYRNDLSKILKNWLLGNNLLSENDLELFNKVFEYINGHIFINQLILNDRNLFNIKNITIFNEKAFINNICDIARDLNYSKIDKLEPLSKYSRYRMNRGYCSKI